MRRFREFVTSAFVTGFLVGLPVYLAMLLILKGMKSLGGLLRPLAVLHPPGMSSAMAEELLALLVIALGCVVLGAAMMTAPGRFLRRRLEDSVLVKVPGYVLVKSLTQQLAGQGDHRWKPALIELGASTVIGFVIEEVDDDRLAVFVPAVPSPVAGALHVLPRQRVHPVDISFAQTFKTLSRWGSGTGEIVAALDAVRASDRS